MKETTGQKPIDEDLPYVFDLLWDIKTRSQLIGSIVHNVSEAHSKIEEMMESNIKFSKNEAYQLLEKLSESIIFIKENSKGE